MKQKRNTFDDGVAFFGGYAEEGITVSKNRIYCQKVIEFEIKGLKWLVFSSVATFLKKQWK